MTTTPLPSPADPATRVLVLERDGCHLCEDALRVVLAEAGRAGVGVERVDVDADPALAAAFGTEVPVIAVDGRVIARYRVDPEALRRALRPGPRWWRLLPGPRGG